MTNMTIFVDTFLGQVANPECSYLTGMMIGAGGVSKITLSFFGILIVYKIVDKLTLEPLLRWIKEKIYSKKNKNEKK